MTTRPLQPAEPIWKQRFRLPARFGWQVARGNPARGLLTSNQSGVFQLYTWDVASGTLRQLTQRPTGVIFGALAPDGEHVYYLNDTGGNELGHHVRVPYAGGEPQDISPDLPPYAGSMLALNATSNLAAFVAAAGGFKVYAQPLGPGGPLGAPRLLFASAAMVQGPVLSDSGDRVVVATNERAGGLHFNLVALDTATGQRLGELWDGPEDNLHFHSFARQPGDPRLLGVANRTGLERPLIWNTATGERLDLPLPELPGDLYPMDWSADGQRLLLIHIHRAAAQLFLYDLSAAALTRLDHPAGTYNGGYFAPSGEIFTEWQDAAHPSELIALDGRTGVRRRTLLAAAVAPPGRPWRAVDFPASDGALLHGWLGVPAGPGPFPTILATPGGPGGAVPEVFAPDSQMWLDNGFAYFILNYHGCSTFGKEFKEKINGDVGHWEVEDLAAAHAWLVGAGVAIPDKILLTGWSYGGYLTLLGLGKRPELWAGGMAGIAIADWVLMYADQAETLRGFQHALFGGPPEALPELYAAASPITYAADVRAPVLVIQGRNDTRCPPRQMEAYEAALKSFGKSIEVHWFDAGHTGVGVEQTIEHQGLMLAFAQRLVA